jgi:hypothetical protein
MGFATLSVTLKILSPTPTHPELVPVYFYPREVFALFGGFFLAVILVLMQGQED